MPERATELRFRHRLIDQLYLEAMLLADEARGYFDDAGRADRDTLSSLGRVSFSCESLKVTTRLMHVIAWLLTQRAVLAGELPMRDALDPSRRLGVAPATEPAAAAALPGRAGALVAASIDLHRRVARFDAAEAEPAASGGPARLMQERLTRSFRRPAAQRDCGGAPSL